MVFKNFAGSQSYNWKSGSDQSASNTTILYSSRLVSYIKNISPIMHSINATESLKIDEIFKYSNGDQMDPNSVVLDCSLCGAIMDCGHSVPFLGWSSYSDF